jgi:hypothetical protein
VAQNFGIGSTWCSGYGLVPFDDEGRSYRDLYSRERFPAPATSPPCHVCTRRIVRHGAYEAREVHIDQDTSEVKDDEIGVHRLARIEITPVVCLNKQFVPHHALAEARDDSRVTLCAASAEARTSDDGRSRNVCAD